MSEWASESQSCLTLCNPMVCSPPGSSVHEFSRQEYWSGLPFPSPANLPNPRDWTRVSWIAGRFFTDWAIREVPRDVMYLNKIHKSLFYQKSPLEGRSRCCLALFLMDHEAPGGGQRSNQCEWANDPWRSPYSWFWNSEMCQSDWRAQEHFEGSYSSISPKCVQTECGSSSCYSCQASFPK